MNFSKKCIFALFFIFNIPTLKAIEKLDQITAIVNESIVLKSDIDRMLSIVKINTKNTGQNFFNEKKLYNKILENLILEKIILQLAEKMQIQISDSVIDETINSIAEQNGLTINQFKQQLLRDGINLQDYRSKINNEIMMQEVRNKEISRQIIILPQEVDLLKKQLNSQVIGQDVNVNLSQILLLLPKYSTNENNQSLINLVKDIFIQLEQGVEFDKLATNYSSDINAFKGGSMGWSKVSELPIEVAKEIQYSKKGDVIGPIRSEIGFHILKINDIKNNNIPILVTEVKTCHILIKFSPIMENRRAYLKIKQIARQIQIGRITFSEAVKKYSEDPLSVLIDKNLKWNILSEYNPIFRDAIMNLSKGEISKPIRSSLGWHLIRLEDIRQIDKTDIIKKDYAYRILFNRKFNEKFPLWLKELRASAYIKIFHDSDM